MAKAVKTREEYDEDHRKKHEDLDRMIEKQRERAARLERINPSSAPYPMSVEETEELEQMLIDVPDEEITEEKVKEMKQAKKIKERNKDEQAKTDTGAGAGDPEPVQPD